MLTSLQNPLVKQMRKLQRSKERHEQQLFLIEGTHLIEEACAVGYPLAIACYTAAWQDHHLQLWQRLAEQTQRLELVSPEVLAAIATTVQPDGVIAAAQRKSTLQPEYKNLSLGVMVETLQDPGNLGTIIRTCAAAGADGLWVSADSVDLDHPKVLRASAGQWFRLPMTASSNLKQTLQDFQKTGVQVVATLPHAALKYWQIDLTRPSLIVLGNEGAGLSDSLMAIADVQVNIPLATGVESLNVAIAAALLLYEAKRQRSTI
jgi:TrmH family RNA methyltransferase